MYSIYIPFVIKKGFFRPTKRTFFMFIECSYIIYLSLKDTYSMFHSMSMSPLFCVVVTVMITISILQTKSTARMARNLLFVAGQMLHLFSLCHMYVYICINPIFFYPFYCFSTHPLHFILFHISLHIYSIRNGIVSDSLIEWNRIYVFPSLHIPFPPFPVKLHITFG